ncbi:putative protein BRICK1-A [Portunus trituberculatus]|uniref:Protein BRICK1 n=1 Tax=Portunus trituberculatus TaxID=210409 RepID=A0A5B7D6I5_PORTR|nr:putative protein BRICK1-A [Portunus trituberculatus]
MPKITWLLVDGAGLAGVGGRGPLGANLPVCILQVITSNIKRIADFLNSFDMSCRSKLSQLNEKLTMLERRIEYLEARVTKGETLN